MPIIRSTGAVVAAQGLLGAPDFDPTYGFGVTELEACGAPSSIEEPDDFDAFWADVRRATRAVDPSPQVGAWRPWRYASGSPTAPGTGWSVEVGGGYEVADLSYTSVGGQRIGGWIVRPVAGADQIAVCGHGYDGRAEPACDDAAPSALCVYPVARGLPTRSVEPGIGREPGQRHHVIWGIEAPETYSVVWSAADFSVAATVALELFEQWYGTDARGAGASGGGPRMIYHGGSFGAGAGALMLQIDDRFDGAVLGVPTFGNQGLRVTQECLGSGQVVREYWLAHPEALETLRYVDAASAARRVRLPVVATPALSDPVVPPPGQFSVVNSLAGPVWRHVLAGGHGEWTDFDPTRTSENPADWGMRERRPGDLGLGQPARPTPARVDEFLRNPIPLSV